MVNRYDADGCQSAIGNYVSYEDYTALENLLIAVVAAVGPCDIPDHLLDALCEAGLLE